MHHAVSLLKYFSTQELGSENDKLERVTELYFEKCF